MSGGVQTFGVIAGAVGSLALAAQVIAQSTAGVRLRREEVTLREATRGPLEPSHLAVVISAYQESVARLMARKAVPPKKFAMASLVALGALWGTFVTGLTALDDDANWYVTASNFGVYLVVLSLCLRLVALYSLERGRVVQEFVDQRSPIVAVTRFRTAWRPDPLGQWLYFLIPALAASIGVFLVGEVFSGVLSDPDAAAAAAGAVYAWMLALAAGGLLMHRVVKGGRTTLVPRGKDDKPTWQHPSA